MWTPLSDPALPDLLARSLTSGRAARQLERVLATAATQSWAARVAVVTSLGKVRLTSRLQYSDPTPAGSIYVTPGDDGRLHLTYEPPHSMKAGGGLVRDESEFIQGLELLLMRLFEDHGRSATHAESQDADPECPRIALGAHVHVVLNERNKTERSGKVVRSIWHHKHQCWHYYIKAGNRAESKRYRAEDLILRPAGPSAS